VSSLVVGQQVVIVAVAGLVDGGKVFFLNAEGLVIRKSN